MKNEEIDADAVIKPSALQAIEHLASRGQTIILRMDQSHINDTNEVPMVSARARKRAAPIAWRVRSTQANIGFAVQRKLLDSVRAWLPDGVSVMRAADRRHGTAQLIGWGQKTGWSYRIRPKNNLTLAHGGGEPATGDVASILPRGVTGAELRRSGVSTNTGVLHDPSFTVGHAKHLILCVVQSLIARCSANSRFVLQPLAVRDS